MSTTEEKVLLLERELKHTSPVYVPQNHLGIWLAINVVFFLFLKVCKPRFVKKDDQKKNEIDTFKMFKFVILFSIISFTAIYVYYHVQRKTLNF